MTVHGRLLTEKRRDARPVPERSHAVFPLHEDLGQLPGARPRLPTHLVYAVGVAGRGLPGQLAVCKRFERRTF